MVERMDQLEAAARNPRMITPLERQRQIGRELFSRFVDAPSVAADETREDQRLRLRPAFCQALFDKELVGAPSCRHRSEGQARAGCAAISRPSADRAIATIWRALSPACSYCACGESWSRKTSGNTIVRILSPWSSNPFIARCCNTWLPKPPIAPSSTVITTSCSRTRRLTRSLSSGLAKRASATVVDRP